MIDGIRFVTVPAPKIGVVVSGANIAVKWPAAATGWMLESSDTLAAGSWAAVPLTGVTDERAAEILSAAARSVIAEMDRR